MDPNGSPEERSRLRGWLRRRYWARPYGNADLETGKKKSSSMKKKLSITIVSGDAEQPGMGSLGWKGFPVVALLALLSAGEPHMKKGIDRDTDGDLRRRYHDAGYNRRSNHGNRSNEPKADHTDRMKSRSFWQGRSLIVLLLTPIPTQSAVSWQHCQPI